MIALRIVAFGRCIGIGWLCCLWSISALPAAAEELSFADTIANAERAVGEGRHAAAADLLRKLLADLDETGDQALRRGEVALRLSRIDQLAGDFDKAERPLLEAIPLLTAAGAPARPVLASLYIELGNLTLAKGALNRAQIALMKGVALARAALPPQNPALFEAELSLATAETRAFRLRDAEKRLARLATEAPAGNLRLAALLDTTRAELNFRQYHYTEALTAQTAAYDGFAALYGADHPETARAATSLATGRFNAGQYQSAEALLREAIAVYERDADFFAPALATSLVNLGQVYYVTGRHALAVRALDRAVTLAAASLGEDSQLGATALLHRGYAYLRDDQLEVAASDLNKAIAIWQKPETLNPRAAAGAAIWLAEVQRRLGALAEAGARLRDSAAILVDIFGADSYAISDIRIGEAKLALSDSRPDDAVIAAGAALGIRVRDLGDDHIAVLEARALLAEAEAAAGDFAAAFALLDVDAPRLGTRVEAIQAAQSESALEEIGSLRRLIDHYLQAIVLALPHLDPTTRAQRLEQSLILAQWSRSSAAGTAIAGLGQRIFADDPAAADALRRFQEAMLRWQLAARQLTASVIAGEATADVRANAALNAAAVAVAREDLRSSYPDLARQLFAAPRDAAALTSLVAPDEALVAYAALASRSYAWIVTGEEIRLVPLPTDAASLQTRIEALRATVNPREIGSLSDIRPYDVAAASWLHDVLIAPLGLPAEIRRLVLVPDGTLQSLPFAALLTAPAAADTDLADFLAYRHLPWLMERFDLAVVPEIGAFADLRAVAKASRPGQPFIGIGDPVFATATSTVSGKSGSDAAAMMAAEIAGLAPLPESRDELVALATTLGAPESSVLAGPAASEARLKELPLEDYRVVAFATHGLMAGDFGRLREPGLALSPPAVPVGQDDGLLTVGEIARLRLDADWVVLSACNTAAADGSPGAEGLSGLARAFFFAGSRSLLVSQWEVLSVAAVELTTGTFKALANDPTLSRAAALRHAMQGLLAEDQPEYFAHPIFWAPFQLVGESS